MKRLFVSLALCAMALVSFTACNEPVEDKGPSAGNFENSELTPDAHKQRLEEIALDVLDVVDPADVEELAIALASLAERYEDEEGYEDIYALSCAVRTLSINGIVDVVTRASEQYIIDANAEDFPYNGLCLVIDEYGEPYAEECEPGTCKVMWDNAVATFTWGENNGQYTMYDEEYDEEYIVKIPSYINVSLAIDGVEHLNVNVEPNFTDKYTYAPNVVIKINGGYEIATQVDANSNKVGYAYSFSKDGQKIIGAAASVNVKGMTNPDNWYVEYYDEFWEEYVTYVDPSVYFVENATDAALQFDLLTLSILAVGDLDALFEKIEALEDKYVIYDEEDNYNEAAEKALYEEFCKYLNKYLDIVAIYNDTQEKIADVVFQSRKIEDYGWVNYTCEPILVFPDGSKFAFEDYFTADSFSTLVERISEILPQ